LGYRFTDEDRATSIYGLIGAIIMLAFSIGTPYMHYMTFSGLGVGVLIGKMIFKFRKEVGLNAKRREVALLFEAVEFYIRAGMSIPQAMYSAKLLTPGIEKDVLRCISLWPKSSSVALESFRKEVGVPEADVLVALLQRIDKTGLANLDGVIQRESRNIEKMRETAARSRIAMRPVYYMAYRMLPLVASTGIFIGSFVYRLMLNFSSMGIKF